MTKRDNQSSRRSDCPIACVLDLVGDRWTLLVIRDLTLGKKHFEEFLDSPEGIASNILSARLKTLQADGLVEKRTDSGDRRKSVYELTEQGRSLRSLLRCLARWGLQNIPSTEVLPGAK